MSDHLLTRGRPVSAHQATEWPATCPACLQGVADAFRPVMARVDRVATAGDSRVATAGYIETGVCLAEIKSLLSDGAFLALFQDYGLPWSAAKAEKVMLVAACPWFWDTTRNVAFERRLDETFLLLVAAGVCDGSREGALG